MLLVGAVPLLIGLTMVFLQGTKEIQEVSGNSFEALATETARKIDLIISDEISRTAQITKDISIIHALESRRDHLASFDEPSLQTLIEKETTTWKEKQTGFVEKLLKGQSSPFFNNITEVSLLILVIPFPW